MRQQSLLVILFSSTILVSQTSPTTQPKAASAAQRPADVSATPQVSSPPEIPPNAPVLTLQGLCPDKPIGTDPKSPECKTIVTRAEFEHLVNTLSPNMPPNARQSLATDYARMLVISAEARKRGLENTARYKDLLNFLKMQVLAQELLRNYQEQAKPSTEEVEKYYNDNASKYEQLSVKRLFIPRNRAETPGAGTTAPATQPKPLTDAELQAQGDKLRARLIAGEDFDKIEKEVYEAAGFKTPPPPTSIPNWPREAVPATEQQLFELKPNEYSKVMIEPAGAYVYQLVEKKRTPLAQVKPQIESMLTNEKVRSMMDKTMSAVKTEPNQEYFRMMPTGPTSAPPPSGSHPPASSSTQAPTGIQKAVPK